MRRVLLAITLIATSNLSAQARQPRMLAVSDETSRDVMLLDATTGKVIATIPTTERPRGIHATSDGKRVYVALSDNFPNVATGRDAIGAIDVARRQLVARLPGGTDPEQFAITPD